MKKHRKNNFNDDTRVYTPKKIIPQNEQLIITDNFTEVNGRVYNRSDENAEDAREWVNDIKL